MELTTMTQDGFIEGLCRCYQSQLNAYLTQMVGSFDIAQELSQQSFEHIHKMYKPSDVLFPRAMLFRVATNLALMHIRRQRIERKLWSKPVDLEQVKEEVPDFNVVPFDRQLFAEQVGDCLAATIKHLSAPYRRVFVMAHIQAKSRREIAAALGVSEKRVDKRMTKALKTCRDDLALMGVDLSDIDHPKAVVDRVSNALARHRNKNKTNSQSR